jgi:hypothetical protein
MKKPTANVKVKLGKKGIPAIKGHVWIRHPRPKKPARATQTDNNPRWRKLLKLGQAHLAPGMSLQRWRDLLDLYDIGELLDAPDNRLDGLIAEISEIVRLAKTNNERESSP